METEPVRVLNSISSRAIFIVLLERLPVLKGQTTVVASLAHGTEISIWS